MTINHTIREGYNYNYIFDAAHLFWAARWLELNRTLDVKENLLNQLMIQRLRAAAKQVLNQGVSGLIVNKESPAMDMDMISKLLPDEK